MDCQGDLLVLDPYMIVIASERMGPFMREAWEEAMAAVDCNCDLFVSSNHLVIFSVILMLRKTSCLEFSVDSV